MALEHPLELLHVVRVHRGIPAAAQRAWLHGYDRALRDRLAAVGNHFPRIDLDLLAESAARRTGAVRRIEREQARRELLEREPAIDAGKRLAERQLPLGLPGACRSRVRSRFRWRAATSFRPNRRAACEPRACGRAGRRRPRSCACASCRGRSSRRVLWSRRRRVRA